MSEKDKKVIQTKKPVITPKKPVEKTKQWSNWDGKGEKGQNRRPTLSTPIPPPPKKKE